MEILIIHLGTQCECFAATSIIKGLKKQHKKHLNIYCIVKDNVCKKVFQYNKNIRKIYPINNVPYEFQSKRFDKIINLHPNFTEEKYFSPNAKDKYGFHYTDNKNKLFRFLYGKMKTRKNLFQIYYGLADLIWRGEGYDFYYKTKSRCDSQMTGIYVVNINLRDYVIEKLDLDLSKLADIPFRQNIFRKVDELYKYHNIITDDFLIFNLSLFLRKNIFFLETVPFNYRLELFGCGKTFKVPYEIIQQMSVINEDIQNK